MQVHLYLSLIPESLIASQLPPEEFGSYYAVGNQKHSRGQAMFFEVSRDFKSDWFPMEEIAKRCVPHEDGSPRKSTYLGIYRALEHIPMEALGKLYIVTNDGRVLGLTQGKYVPDPTRELHLYQELCPVTPRVASKLDPVEFAKTITDPKNPVHVPRIIFSELRLLKLAQDLDTRDVNDLPYANIDHMRDCLREIKRLYAKPTKLVDRQLHADLLYRTIRGGFFVGDQKSLLYYPMPTLDELETRHYAWWRSALSSFGG